MVVSSIADEPQTNHAASSTLVWLASCQPIYFKVYADSIVPPEQPMFCDIYMGSVVVAPVYYKTILSYSIVSAGGSNSVFEFDVQDAYQEYIKTNFPSNLGITPSDSLLPYQAVETYCKFRGSSYVSGVLIQEGAVPVQATATSAAVAGGGYKSGEYTVLNATVPGNGYQNLTFGLNWLRSKFQLNQIYGGSGFPVDTAVFPLSNLPVNQFKTIPYGGASKPIRTEYCPDVYAGQSGAFPIVIIRFAAGAGLSDTLRLCSLYVQWFNDNSAVPSGLAVLQGPSTLSVGCYYLPFGLREIAALAPAAAAAISDPNNNAYYKVYLFDHDKNKECFFSPVFKGNGGAVEPYRLWFQNYYGHFEQVSFVRTSEAFKTSSSEQFKSYPRTFKALSGSVTPSLLYTTGRKRYNVRTDTEISLTATFPEALLPWLKELMSSPYCMTEDTPPGASYSRFYSFTSWEVVNGSFETKKSVIQGRINYVVTIKIRPSIQEVQLRN